MLNFLVTTNLETLNTKIAELGECSVVMIDGTVPGWEPREIDWHFDHHRPGGDKVQIEDIEKQIDFMAEEGVNFSDLCPIDKRDNILFATTQLDADAVSSAVHLYLTYLAPDRTNLYCFNGRYTDNYSKLVAISYDCDHLAVPPELSNYADFAAKCVAGMKCESDDLAIDLDMPKDRREWTIEQKEYFHSRAFEKSFWDLVRAIEGKDNWPCDHPKISEYWEKVEKFTNQLIEENRISFYKNCAVVTMSGLGGTYIDPRCTYRAIDRILEKKGQNISFYSPITLTQREVIVDNKYLGNKYTLACNPNHPETEKIDFTTGTYTTLSIAEKERDPSEEGWGGRATVGGSGWNTCSNLSPWEVIEIVLRCINF